MGHNGRHGVGYASLVIRSGSAEGGLAFGIAAGVHAMPAVSAIAVISRSLSVGMCPVTVMHGPQRSTTEGRLRQGHLATSGPGCTAWRMPSTWMGTDAA